jgi:transposase
MTGKTKLIDSLTLEIASSGLKALGSYGVVATKLRAILSAGEYGIAPVARIYGVARSTLTNWIKSVKVENPLSSLEVGSGRGRKSKLSVEQMGAVEQWLLSDPGITIDKVRATIKGKFNIDIGRSTVHRIIQKLSYSYITPRPIHHKQNKSEHDNFKKNGFHKGAKQP